MKLLADEDFPPTLISYLQKHRQNVKRIQRTSKTISDTSVRNIAIKENRIIFTFDKDFLKTEKKTKSCSIVVFNFPYMKPSDILTFMDKAVKSIVRLKKQKQHFIATYSITGLEVLS